MELFISYKNKRPVAERLHQPIKVQLYTYSCAETVPYSALVTQPRKFIFVINYTYTHTHTHTRARARTHTHTHTRIWLDISNKDSSSDTNSLSEFLLRN
jgi:hypothetical protein